ncbi:MAG: hydantoinase/oxoprolinase family protein [Deltaproteobacteria bacterium]|nr:MAG: hydantoinase/oxoprolinase family protein [Deltaproteobacteria bacterium]
MRIGIDTGGTFTDFVVLVDGEFSVHKELSTPIDPSIAIYQGIKKLIGDKLDGTYIYHGTTIATNALLERKGSKIVLITTKGFEDIIEIGRQNRKELYNIFEQETKPLVERPYRVGIKERADFKGNILEQISKAEMLKLKNKIKKLKPEAIAISLINSYASSKNELIVENLLKDLGIPISVSSRILPEFREYERTSTVVINAYLIKKVFSYMNNLKVRLKQSKIFVLQSNGGLISTEQAGSEPVRILLSGPAGGVVGAFKIAEKVGMNKIMTYDMGGTSTDVSLCDGSIKFSNINTVDNLAVNVPMVDVKTIGAGGGSIAYIDPGGALKVGPESAGSDPGPACYGKGDRPTVTDANVVLGRINPDYFLGGEMKIFKDRSARALRKLSKQLGISTLELASGIIEVANANMEKALRVISLERGYDPREFALFSFGGAGGLHACELARGLGISKVIFPSNPGVLSALGMLIADYFRDYSMSVFFNSEKDDFQKISKAFRRLEKRPEKEYTRECIKYEYYIDARYKRQSHELIIPFNKSFIKTFHNEHKKKYGYSQSDNIVEIVNIRLRALSKKVDFKIPECTKVRKQVTFTKSDIFYNNKNVLSRIYSRDDFYSGYKFRGPAIVLEKTSTLFVTPGFNCQIENYGNIIATC